ncbi:MAG: hypothetical protein R2711_03345 [Acidimicrobiales bacterium]
MGRGADLSGSTGTLLKGHEQFDAETPQGAALLRRAQARHGRSPTAWPPGGVIPGRRHLLRVLRLHAPRRAPSRPWPSTG